MSSPSSLGRWGIEAQRGEMTCPRPHSSDEAAASQGGGTEGEPSATGVRMDLNPGFCVLAQGSTQQQAWLLESPIPSKQGIYPGKFPKVGPCTASVYEKVSTGPQWNKKKKDKVLSFSWNPVYLISRPALDSELMPTHLFFFPAHLFL